MILGNFGEIGELIFEIDLIAADEERYPLEVLLDTGFTTGYLALDSQDVQGLGWSIIEGERAMQMARGRSFLIYMRVELYWMKGSTLSQF
jgi:predicted aspartyl protease